MKRTIYLLMLLLLAGCAERGAMRRQMAVADSLVTVNPDSALLYLERIDTAGLRLSERMHLELMRGKAITRAGNLITTDTVAKRVAAYYDEWPHRDANRRMLAHYYLGMAYRDMGSAIRALEEFQTAASVADTASARCDLPTLMRVHSQMETVFMNQRLYDLQKAENKIARDLSWRMGDTLSALLFEDHLCDILYKEGRYAECLEATEKLYQRFLAIGLPDDGALLCIIAARSALMLGDYPTMKKYLDIYETSSYLRENLREVRGGIAPLYEHKGFYYLGIHALDSAEYYFRRTLIEKGLYAENELVAYEGLSQVYGQIHQADSAFKYAVLYSDAIVQEYNQANSQAIIHMKSLYDYGVEQKIAKEKTRENGRLKVGLLAICVMLLLIYSYYRLANERKKRRISELNLGILETSEKLRVAETQLAIYEESKEANQEQIAASEKTIREMEETITWQRNELDRLLKHTPEQELSNSEIIAQLRKAVSEPTRKNLDSIDWQGLSTTVENAFPSFYSQMNQNENLSMTEYRLCLLVKAGFSPSQIETLLDLTPKYASTLRRRLHLKVFGEEGSPAEFDKKVRSVR